MEEIAVEPEAEQVYVGPAIDHIVEISGAQLSEFRGEQVRGLRRVRRREPKVTREEEGVGRCTAQATDEESIC